MKDIDTLKSVVALSYMNSPFDNYVGYPVDSVNKEIARLLTKVLTNPEIVGKNLDSLIPISSAHSEDGRLHIFAWDDNNGGTMRYHNNLLQYYIETGVPKVAFTWVETEQENEDTILNIFCSEAAAFYEIHRLRATGKNLYLCLGTGRSCSTCIYKMATVVELVGDSINFLYPAFPDNEEETQWTNNFGFDARMDDIEEFAFDNNTQALTYIYREDAYSEDPDSLLHKGRLVFNGVKFINKPY